MEKETNAYPTIYYQDKNNYSPIFNDFTKRFLEEKKSIFNLDSELEILTIKAIDYLMDNFVNNGYTGNADFFDKIKQQLLKKPPTKADHESIISNAIEILATAAWLWRLPPSNSTQEGRKKSVLDILKLDPNNKFNIKDKENNKYFGKNLKGFAKPGTLYNTSKPAQLAYIIKFFKSYLQGDFNSEPIEILNSKEFKGKITIEVKFKYDIDNNKESITPKKDEYEKNVVSIHDALLFLFKPKEYEPILSQRHKKQIAEAFFDKLNDTKDYDSVDNKLMLIRNSMGINPGDFYDPKYREKWDPEILPAKNIIFYGAPGTGKTYEVTNLVQRKTDSDSDYTIQQFHPSFNYEDFIDGVKPCNIKNTSMSFRLVNGEFKKLCIKAFKELIRFKNLNAPDKKKERMPKQFYFIADEINRAELSRVFGELLLCLEEDKRLRFDENGNLLGIKIKTQNSMLWEKEHAVVIMKDNKVINEISKNEPEDIGGDYEFYFGIPENIFFLGTMNDIDKSIDSFDLALRRRFKWIYKGCNYDVIADELLEKGADDDTIDDYLNEKTGRCIKLNRYISETLNLGCNFELGHSYYMKIRLHGRKIPSIAYEQLFDYEIGPLVTEYLRAEYPSGKELDGQLKKMRNIFSKGNL
jgi:hypothetical protein